MSPQRTEAGMGTAVTTEIVRPHRDADDAIEFVGSAGSVGAGVEDVLAANISPSWKPAGVNILSGFEAADADAVRAALERA